MLLKLFCVIIKFVFVVTVDSFLAFMIFSNTVFEVINWVIGVIFQTLYLIFDIVKLIKYLLDMILVGGDPVVHIWVII